ncbi:MAG: site-2 protease family protein [Planctomycetota bacterium]|nr:MAG: site-2 protease family protein [Planctomycetota bacterium]
MPDLVQGFLLYGVFLVSTVLHEAAHAWAALRGGDRTAYEGGQVTLNPMPHIRRSPFGMVILPVMSVLASGWPIGFASVPYNREWARRHPKRAGWMALAGPGANLFLILLAALFINLGVIGGVFYAPDTIGFADVTAVTAGAASFWQPVASVLGAVFALNLLLFVFNLLPIPPLDGHSALLSGFPGPSVERWQDFLAMQPGVMWIGIFLAWKLFDEVFDPVFVIAISALYPGVTYGR